MILLLVALALHISKTRETYVRTGKTKKRYIHRLFHASGYHHRSAVLKTATTTTGSGIDNL